MIKDCTNCKFGGVEVLDYCLDCTYYNEETIELKWVCNKCEGSGMMAVPMLTEDQREIARRCDCMDLKEKAGSGKSVESKDFRDLTSPQSLRDADPNEPSDLRKHLYNLIHVNQDITNTEKWIQEHYVRKDEIARQLRLALENPNNFNEGTLQGAIERIIDRRLEGETDE